MELTPSRSHPLVALHLPRTLVSRAYVFLTTRRTAYTLAPVLISEIPTRHVPAPGFTHPVLAGWKPER
jgi:hypothetical protein